MCAFLFSSPFFSFQGLKNVTVIEGESVTLECHISGYPSPKVTWFREDYQIESSIDFQITFQNGIARLMIREAFAEDSGRFTCSAVNEAGTVSTSCYLAVQGWWWLPSLILTSIPICVTLFGSHILQEQSLHCVEATE